jgi:hypothetical protein
LAGWIIVGLIIIGLLVLGLALLLLVLRGRGFRRDREPNYKTFYFIGLSWLGTGTVFTIIYAATDLPFVIGIPFLGIGVTYVAIGLANRDKWT